MASTPSARRRRLGEILIEAGVLDATRLEAALSEQKKWGGKLGRTLVEMGFVTEDVMVRALSRQLKLPVVDLDQVKLPQSIVQLLRVDLAERYGVFPLGADTKGRTLQVATADPTNAEALNDLEFSTNSRIQVAVATGSSIDRAIRRMYYGETTTSTATATPASLGMTEASYELKGPPPPPPPPPQPAAPGPIDPLAEMESAAQRAELKHLKERVAEHEKSASEIARLKEQVAELERHSANQVRALRALVEQLIESGLISRDEYVTRVKRNE